MSECEHEWEIGLISKGVQLEFVGECAVDGCNEVLSQKEVNCRLNATERLSAEDAREASRLLRLLKTQNVMVLASTRHAIKTYADILESKDD